MSEADDLREVDERHRRRAHELANAVAGTDAKIELLRASVTAQGQAIGSHTKRLDRHAQRIEQLEKSGMLTAHIVEDVRAAIKRVEEFMEKQERRMDALKLQVARWGGGIAAIMAFAALYAAFKK